MANPIKNNQDQVATHVLNLNGGDTVEVLYQRLGDRWYAFSLVGDDVYVGAVDPSELDPEAAPKREMPAA